MDEEVVEAPEVAEEAPEEVPAPDAPEEQPEDEPVEPEE
jgi:hypothetical protein